MPRGGSKKGHGLREFDKCSFEELCKIQCSKTEICAVLNCDDETLSDWCKRVYGKNFRDVRAKYAEDGKASLRRTQFRMAEKSVPMAIFLGKNYLKQSDQQNFNHTIEPVVIKNDLTE